MPPGGSYANWSLRATAVKGAGSKVFQENSLPLAHPDSKCTAYARLWLLPRAEAGAEARGTGGSQKGHHFCKAHIRGKELRTFYKTVKQGYLSSGQRCEPRLGNNGVPWDSEHLCAMKMWSWEPQTDSVIFTVSVSWKTQLQAAAPLSLIQGGQWVWVEGWFGFDLCDIQEQNLLPTFVMISQLCSLAWNASPLSFFREKRSIDHLKHGFIVSSNFSSLEPYSGKEGFQILSSRK